MIENKISGVKTAYSCDGEQIFVGFYLYDCIAEVDPFVDGVYNIEFATAKDQIKWAKNQIGKTLKCDSFIYSAIATSGNVEIVGGSND